MHPVIIRIDPGVPLCWEDERTLRFGFDRPELRIIEPSATVQRLIGALADGVRSDRVERTLSRIGATRAEWKATLIRFAPILRHDPLPHSAPPSPGAEVSSCEIEVVGAEPVAARFRLAFAAAGFAPAGEGSAPMDRARASPGATPSGYRSDPAGRSSLPRVLVSLERFLALPVPPDRTFPAGPPRLTVRFGDRHVDVGPLASLDDDPCPSCVALGDVDADPSLPVLAAQLLGGVPASETAAAAELAAALAGSLIRARLAGARSLGGERLRITVLDGLPLPAIDRVPVTRHHDCGCGIIRPAPAPLPP